MARFTETQVEDYVFYLREEKKVAKGTFQEYFFVIRLLYVNTLTRLGEQVPEMHLGSP